MPAPPEDDRKKAENLPDPELNPMTNTLLAQNMGRWAEVYFTTPPERRDEAVQELLRELRGGVKNTQHGAPEEKISVSEQDILDAKQKFIELEKKLSELQRNPVEGSGSASVEAADRDLVCPACMSKNKAGQRFCGLCGFTLFADRHSPAKREQPVVPPRSEPLPIERAGDDWSWLHEKNRTALAGQQHERTNWKYIILVVLVLVGGGLGYFWWRNSLQISSADEKSRNSVTRDEDSGKSVPIPGGTDESSSRRVPVDKGSSASQPRTRSDREDEKQSSSDASADVATRTPPNSNSEDSGAVPEGGMQELETARRYLDGRGVPKDSALAAQWLWKSIAKKNTDALVVLSEMYAAGEGVPKSCDQARLLLTAAARKGSQEATDRLKTVISSCQ